MPTTLHDMQVADRSDDPPRYAVAGYRGVAFAFIRPDTETVPVEPCWDETLDDNGNPMDADVWWPPDGWETEEIQTGMAVMHMVGDDHPHIIDPADCTPLNDDDYCGGCGQIGCGWH